MSNDDLIWRLETAAHETTNARLLALFKDAATQIKTHKHVIDENQGLRAEIKELDSRLAGQRRREGQSHDDRLREIKREEGWEAP